MSFESLKKSLKETGMSIIGQEGQVLFRRRVEDLIQRFRLSKEQAEKKELAHALQGLYSEAAKGMISLDSGEYKNFISGLAEIIGKEGLAACREAGYRGIIRPVMATVNSFDIDKIHVYYKKKTAQQPIHTIALDTAVEVKRLKELSHRSGRELLGYVPSKQSLETILSLHPELKMDIGRIIICKEVIERHEKQHTNRLAYEASVKDLKKTASETVAEALMRAPSDFLKKINTLPADGKGFDGKKIVKGMGYAGELVGRELKAGGKLSVDLLKTLYRFGKK